jgi:hypothetical protein
VKRGGQLNGRATATGKVEGRILPKRRLGSDPSFASAFISQKPQLQ